jgi:hypothetical protein
MKKPRCGANGKRSHTHPGAANDGRRRSIREISDRSETPRRADAEASQRGTLRGSEALRLLRGRSASLVRIKALRAEGLGFDRVAARLNEERVPTRTGRPWHGVVINRILTGKR